MTILVDTNILIDMLGRDPVWLQASLDSFLSAVALVPLIVNDIVYAELAAGYRRAADVDEALRSLGVDLVPMTREALCLAGGAFARYRRTGGTRTGVLPDFFIGAQAQVEALPLLTRDPKRYRTYFPSVDLIVPTL